MAATVVESVESGVPPFVHKLHHIVDDPDYDYCIGWDVGGHSFYISDQSLLSEDILPLYFKHRNLASFIRQLNIYGFNKVTAFKFDDSRLEVDESMMHFRHPNFIKGKLHLLENIQRQQKTKGNATNPTTIIKSMVDTNKQLVGQVLTDINVIHSKQDDMDNKFNKMKNENEALWRELTILRQKHTQQQQIVNSLIQFLGALITNSRNNAAKPPNNRKRPLMIDSASPKIVYKKMRPGTATARGKIVPTAGPSQDVGISLGPTGDHLYTLSPGGDVDDTIAMSLLSSPRQTDGTPPVRAPAARFLVANPQISNLTQNSNPGELSIPDSTFHPPIVEFPDTPSTAALSSQIAELPNQQPNSMTDLITTLPANPDLPAYNVESPDLLSVPSPTDVNETLLADTVIDSILKQKNNDKQSENTTDLMGVTYPSDPQPDNIVSVPHPDTTSATDTLALQRSTKSPSDLSYYVDAWDLKLDNIKQLLESQYTLEPSVLQALNNIFNSDSSYNSQYFDWLSEIPPAITETEEPHQDEEPALTTEPAPTPPGYELMTYIPDTASSRLATPYVPDPASSRLTTPEITETLEYNNPLSLLSPDTHQLDLNDLFNQVEELD